MSSSTSSRQSSPAEQEQGTNTMQIFVKTVGGETTTLSLPRDTTISHLKTLLPLPNAQTDPQTLRLIHAGSTLSSPESTLSSLNLPNNATLHVALPLRGGAPKKPRCSFKDCKEKAQPIVGDCGFCSGKFCSKHRMLESHACQGMEECKDQARRDNAAKLEGERTRPQATV